MTNWPHPLMKVIRRLQVGYLHSTGHSLSRMGMGQPSSSPVSPFALPCCVGCIHDSLPLPEMQLWLPNTEDPSRVVLGESLLRQVGLLNFQKKKGGTAKLYIFFKKKVYKRFALSSASRRLIGDGEEVFPVLLLGAIGGRNRHKWYCSDERTLIEMFRV
jgi:hypothetical protein